MHLEKAILKGKKLDPKTMKKMAREEMKEKSPKAKALSKMKKDC